MKPDPAASARPAPRLLVVDDEEIVLVALRETLRQQGYSVDTAPSAVHGLELVRRERYAVVISDQQMPMLTGLEMLAQVRKIQPDATRILITAVLNLNTVIDAINKAEVYRFILKPWQRDDLLRAVLGGVERHEAILCRAGLLQATLAENERLNRLNQALTEQLRALGAPLRSVGE